MIERMLRWTGVAIAIAAFIDPPVTVAGRTRTRLSIAVQDGPSMALPAASGTESRRATALRIRDTLIRDLDASFDVVAGRDESAPLAVVIGDRYQEHTDRARVSSVTVSAPLSPNVRIARVEAPRTVPPVTAVRMTVTLDAVGVHGATTSLVARVGGAEVGRVSHAWSSDRESWVAELDAVPVGEPPFLFELLAEPLSSERTAADNRAVVGVDQAPRLRVLVLEARPSWAAAFVRRALEGDRRFDVSGLGQAAPRAIVRTGELPASPLESSPQLASFDTIVVGGLDALTAAQVEALDRFMRERGGTVALVPDSRAIGPLERRLLDGASFSETLLDRSATLAAAASGPRLDASELLEASELPADAAILVRSPSSNRAIVWTAPHGAGRLLFSGAMDAWRFRAEGAFDRFWRSVISGLALAARPAVDLQLEPRRAAPGERVSVTVRVRPLEQRQFGDRLAISARAGQAASFRLLPSATPGVFSGSFVVDPHQATSSIVVTATLGDRDASGSARLTIDRGARDADAPPLAWLSASRGGLDVIPEQLPSLERHLRASVPATSAEQILHPMRSAWWCIPFAACLSAEWWLRRRAGRR